jgi:hypothetical protein
MRAGSRIAIAVACALPACSSTEFTVGRDAGIGGLDASSGGGVGGSNGGSGGSTGGTAGNATGGSSGSTGGSAGSSAGGTAGGSGGSSGKGGTGGATGGTGGTAGRGGTGGATVDAGRDSGTGGAGGIPFDAGAGPPVTADLLLWFDAARLALAPNSKVSRWKDNALPASDAIQATSSLQPTFVQINGAPAVSFDGIDDHLILPGGFDVFSNGMSAFVVLRPTRSACEQIMQFATGEEQNDVSIQIAGTLAFEFEVENGSLRAPDNLLAINTMGLGTVVQFPTTPTATVLHVNSDEVAATNNMFLPQSVDRNKNTIGTGQYVSTCNAFQGAVFEILMYTRALSDPEIGSVEGYLQSKWSCCQGVP